MCPQPVRVCCRLLLFGVYDSRRYESRHSSVSCQDGCLPEPSDPALVFDMVGVYGGEHGDSETRVCPDEPFDSVPVAFCEHRVCCRCNGRVNRYLGKLDRASRCAEFHCVDYVESAVFGSQLDGRTVS